MNPGTSTPNGSSDAISLYFGTVTGGGAFKFGVRGGGASTAFTSAATPYALNTTYLVVMGYNFNGGVAANNMSVWVNPIPGGSMPTADLTLTPTTVATAIDNVGFKVQSAPAGTFLVDNLLIGTTWADVTPTPEPSTVAFAALGLLGGFIAAWRAAAPS